MWGNISRTQVGPGWLDGGKKHKIGESCTEKMLSPGILFLKHKNKQKVKMCPKRIWTPNADLNTFLLCTEHLWHLHDLFFLSGKFVWYWLRDYFVHFLFTCIILFVKFYYHQRHSFVPLLLFSAPLICSFSSNLTFPFPSSLMCPKTGVVK